MQPRTIPDTKLHMPRTLQHKKKIIALLILTLQTVFLFMTPMSFAFAQEGSWTNTGPVGSSTSSGANAPTLWDMVKHPIDTATAAASGVVGEVADATIGNVLKGVGYLFFQVGGKFLQVMALGLDMSIDKTIDSSMYKGLSAIQVGWTAIRDISNMFFIFVLLYIAIQTILGMADGKTKRMVAHLIIAALLINFSLFATQVVVDAGNMLTVGFWSNIKTTQASGTTGGFAPVVMEGLKIQTAFNGGQGSNTDKAKIYFGGAIVMFIAGYVLLAGAIMMIVRTVTLIILMIVSPFAFLGFALPTGGGFAKKWLDELIGATFVAPAFVMMLYLNMIIIRSLDITNLGAAGGSGFAAVFAGDVSNFAIIYNFLVVIILLLASLKVANSISKDAGSSAGAWAKKAIGYGGAAGFGGAAWGLRKSVGNGASKLKNNEAIQKAAQQTGMKGMMARTALRTSNAAARSSFDVRNAPGMKSAGASALAGYTGVKFGSAGGAGGELAQRQAKDQAIIKKAEELFPNNPIAQQNYIANATKTLPSSNIFTQKGRAEAKDAWGKAITDKKLPSRLDQKPGAFANKEDKVLSDKKKTLEVEQKTKEAKEKLTTEPAKYDALKTQLDTLKATGASTADIQAGEVALAASVDEMTKALRTVGSKHISELTLDNSADGMKNRALLKSEAFNKAAGGEHWKAIENREDVDKAFLGEMRESGLKNGNKRSQEYLVRQMRNEDSRFYVDNKAAVKSQLASYSEDATHSKKIADYEMIMGGGTALDPAQQADFDSSRSAILSQRNPHRKAIATRLGYMTPEQVADLEPSDLTNSAVAQGLTPSMIQEMIKGEKTNLKYGKDFFANLKKEIDSNPNANRASKLFVERAAQTKDSPFNPAYGV